MEQASGSKTFANQERRSMHKHGRHPRKRSEHRHVPPPRSTRTTDEIELSTIYEADNETARTNDMTSDISNVPTQATLNPRTSAPVTIIFSPDAKKEAFRDYIKSGNLKQAFVRAIVALFEEWDKPEDPLVWITRYMGFGIPKAKEIEECKAKIQELREKLDTALAENVKLKAIQEILDEDTLDLCCKDWQYYLNFDYSQLTEIRAEMDELTTSNGSEAFIPRMDSELD